MNVRHDDARLVKAAGGRKLFTAGEKVETCGYLLNGTTYSKLARELES